MVATANATPTLASMMIPSGTADKDKNLSVEISVATTITHPFPWAPYVCVCSLIALAWAAEILFTPSQPTVINVFSFLFLVLCGACAAYGEINIWRENSSRRRREDNEPSPHPGYSDDDVPALDMYIGALKHVDTIFGEDPTRKLTAQQERDVELVSAAAQLPFASTPPPFHRDRAQSLRTKLYDLLIDTPAVDDDELTTEIVDRRTPFSPLTERTQ